MLNYKTIEEFLQVPLTNEEKEKISKLEETSLVKNFSLIGNIYNRLLVIGRGPSAITAGGHKKAQWWCICNCKDHTILLVTTNNLQTGNTKSCGCWNKEKSKERIIEVGHKVAKDIKGLVFSDLTALEPTEERNNGSVVWKCLCSCGKIHYASAKELLNNRIKSCGHNTESFGSKKIKEILTNNNIKFETEKTFSTCKFPDTNANARFDFYLPDYNLLIEYDGIQHFKQCDDNYFRDSLEKRQMHDKFKTEWCKKQGIKLKRIPYTMEQDLSIELLLN